MKTGSMRRDKDLFAETTESRYAFVDLGKQLEAQIPAAKPAPVINKNSVKQHAAYSGGFKMLDLPSGAGKPSSNASNQRTTSKEKSRPDLSSAFDYDSFFPKKDEVFSKLGIDHPSSIQKQSEPEEEASKKNLYVNYNKKFGINQKEFYSAEEPEVQGEFRSKLINEVDHKISKIQQKRDILNHRKEGIVIAEKRKALHLKRDDEEQLTEAQKVALYKNADADVDTLIHQTWEKRNPNIDQVENVIDKHRERLRELEQMYYKRKERSQLGIDDTTEQSYNQPVYMQNEVVDHLVDGQLNFDSGHQKSFRTLNDKLVRTARYTPNQIMGDDYSQDEKKQRTGKFDGDMYDFEYLRREQITEDEHEADGDLNDRKEASPPRRKQQNLRDSDVMEIKMPQSSNSKQQNLRQNQQVSAVGQSNAKGKRNSDIDEHSLEVKKANTVQNEKERKLRILHEEMAEVERLMQEPGAQVKKVFIEPSEKAIRNATHIPVEQKIYEHKFKEYLIDKSIVQENDARIERLAKPDFERVRSAKSFDKYKKLHPEPPADLTITDRPVELVKDFKSIVKQEDEAHIQQYTKEIEDGKRSVENTRMAELYKRILKESKDGLKQRKQKDDEFVLKFMFVELDKAKSGVLSTKEIFESLKSNKDAILFFDICVRTLYADLDKYPTSRHGLFNLNEFVSFVRKQSELSKQTLRSESDKLREQLQLESNPLTHNTSKLKDPADLLLLYEKDPVNTYGACVLNEPKIDALRGIFCEIDKHSDYIVKRMELIDMIRKDFRVQQILSYPAVKIPIVNRYVSLAEVLEIIEGDYKQSDERMQKSKEYISWNQFFDYFKNYAIPSFLTATAVGTSEESKVFELSEDFLQLIQDVFDSIPRVSRTLDFVATADFVIAAKKDPQIRSISNMLAREKSVETGINSEEIGVVLDRVLEEGGEYLQWHELKLFFSQRGRPMGRQFEDQSNEVAAAAAAAAAIVSEKAAEEEKQKSLKEAKRKESAQQEDSKKKKKPKWEKDLDEKRMDGEFDSGEEYYDINDDDNEQGGKEENDLDEYNEEYSQLKRLDYMRNGGKKPEKKSSEQVIAEHYNTKRVVMKQQPEDQELNEFDTYYKELLQKQKEAELGPLNSIGQREIVEDPVKYGILKQTAVDYDKYFSKLSKHNKVHAKDKQEITVPKPFGFDSREATKEKTIYQMKKQQYLEEVQRRDEEEMKKRFKANPIPTTTKVPMYNNIIEKNKEKREKVRQESQKMTLATQQPFSFYDRDIQKREDKKQIILDSVTTEMNGFKQKTFKAKDVPASSKMDMMKQMQQEKDDERKKRIEERKDEQLKSVKEFSRMANASEQWKDVLKKRETTKTWEEEKCTFAPKVNTVVPETSKGSSSTQQVESAATKLQAVSAFASLIKKKPSTEPEPFNFAQPVPKQANRDKMDDYNASIKSDKLKPSNLLARLAPMKKKVEEEVEEPAEDEVEDVKDEPENQDENGEGQQDNNNQEIQAIDNNVNEEGQEQEEVNQSTSKKPNKGQKGEQEPEKKQKTTKSEELLQKKREEEKKKKLEEEEKVKKEKEAREKKLKDRAGEVRDKFDTRTAKQVQEEAEKQRQKDRQQRAKEEKEEYQAKLDEMNSRIKNKKLLTENKTHGSTQLDKYRKLQAAGPAAADQTSESNAEPKAAAAIETTVQDNKKESASNNNKKGNKTELEESNISVIVPKKGQVKNAEDEEDDLAEEKFDEEVVDDEGDEKPVKRDDFDELSD